MVMIFPASKTPQRLDIDVRSTSLFILQLTRDTSGYVGEIPAKMAIVIACMHARNQFIPSQSNNTIVESFSWRKTADFEPQRTAKDAIPCMSIVQGRMTPSMPSYPLLRCVNSIGRKVPRDDLI